MKIHFLFAVLFFFIYSSLTAQTSSANSNISNYQYQALEKLNQIRSKKCKCGKENKNAQGKLKMNPTLNKIAYSHAKELASRGVLSHIGKNGSNVEKRIKNAKYIYSRYGEIIGQGYDTMDEIFTAWMKSPGHCKNIMGDYTECGIANVNGYWVIDFATPRR